MYEFDENRIEPVLIGISPHPGSCFDKKEKIGK
jgi:hypothetical protein